MYASFPKNAHDLWAHKASKWVDSAYHWRRPLIRSKTCNTDTWQRCCCAGNVSPGLEQQAWVNVTRVFATAHRDSWRQLIVHFDRCIDRPLVD